MLKEKRLFLFDIDGTLAVGDTLFPSTRALLSHIEDIGGISIFITNNSTKSRADYVKKFQKWDLHTEEWQFITAGYITMLYLKKQFPQDKIYVLGTDSFIQELENQGLTITQNADEDAACALIGYDSQLTYQKLVTACQVLSRPLIPYLATNPDLCCPAPFGFIPDCGAICNMLESSTGRRPLYLGKPSQEVVRLSLEIAGFTRDQTLVVGDRLYTDIACGIAGGVETCLLLTGEAKKQDLDSTPYRPDYCIEDISEFFRCLLFS